MDAALLTLALSWPAPFQSTEPPELYRARVGVIVSAVETATPRRDLQVALLVLAYRESSFRVEVHSGEVLGDGGRARSLWQLHRSRWTPDWESLSGTDIEATTRSARVALRVVRSSLWLCGRNELSSVSRFAHAFEVYASGKCRAPSHESTSRARAWEWAMVRVGGSK